MIFTVELRLQKSIEGYLIFRSYISKKFDAASGDDAVWSAVRSHMSSERNEELPDLISIIDENVRLNEQAVDLAQQIKSRDERIVELTKQLEIAFKDVKPLDISKSDGTTDFRIGK
jgi:hypothetical protein